MKIDDENKETFDKISREIKMMSMFDHAFIIKIYNYFIEHNNNATYIYIVMEYCEKGSLVDILQIRGGKFDERKAAVILIETWIALEELKKCNIIHRDLKLENILVDAHGHIRISDFGFSRELPPNMKPDDLLTYCGSPAYAAPEIIKKEKYSISADIWSFGIILYVLLYGRFPFFSSNIMETMKKIVYDQPLFNNSISDDANQLLKRMLTKSPTKRITLKEISETNYFQKYKSIIYNSKESSTQKSCYFSNLSNWSFPSIDKKIVNLINTSLDDIKTMIKNHEINDQTALFKILRDKFLQDVIYSKFGGCETDFKPVFPRAILKIDCGYVEATPVQTSRISLLPSLYFSKGKATRRNHSKIPPSNKKRGEKQIPNQQRKLITYGNTLFQKHNIQIEHNTI